MTIFSNGAAAASRLRAPLGGSADVLVGADGYTSVVRRVVDPVPAADTGWATWQGLEPLPIDLAQGRYGLCQVGPAGLCGLMPAGDGLVRWWFDTPWSRTDEPPASVADWLRERFAGYADPVPAVLAAITDAGLYPHVLHRVPKVWGRRPDDAGRGCGARLPADHGPRCEPDAGGRRCSTPSYRLLRSGCRQRGPGGRTCG